MILNVTHNCRKYEVKIYPRPGQVIKSFNSRLHGSVRHALSEMRTEGSTPLTMIHSPGSTTHAERGGLRTEVSVEVPTLRRLAT